MQVTLARVSSAVGIPQSYHLASPILEQGFIAGRNNDSDIVLNTDVLPLLISRKHAKLYVVGQALLLQDEGSTNGTYVDEGRLSPNNSKELVNGNVISFGGPKLIIRDGQQHQNPFVYHVSIVESVTGQAHQRQDLDSEATQAAEAPESNVAAVPAPAASASAAPAVEHSVDLTRASSSEASIVDLTGSPDIRVSIAAYSASCDSGKMCPSAQPPDDSQLYRLAYQDLPAQLGSLQQSCCQTSSYLMAHSSSRRDTIRLMLWYAGSTVY